MSYAMRLVPWNKPAKEVGDTIIAPDSWLTGNFEQAALGNGIVLCRGYRLSTQYIAKRAVDPAYRNPVFVMLPGDFFCIDSAHTEPDNGVGWDVTGEPPKLTVNPSINIGGIYHGWIKDGVVSDDVDGRQWPRAGTPQSP